MTVQVDLHHLQWLSIMVSLTKFLKQSQEGQVVDIQSELKLVFNYLGETTQDIIKNSTFYFPQPKSLCVKSNR